MSGTPISKAANTNLDSGLGRAVVDHGPKPREDDCVGPGLAGWIGAQCAEQAVRESRMVNKARECVCKICADLPIGVDYFVDELFASVDENDHVAEVAAGEEVTLPAALEGLNLGGEEVGRWGGTDPCA